MSASSSTRPIQEKIYKLIKQDIQGEVKKDRATRLAYSCDASIFEVEPLLVVLPKSKNDVIRTLQIASEYSISVTARGAATGTTGGAIGSGIILDLSKYLRSFHFNGKSVRCDPGVVQDELNKALSFYDLRLGPDTSSGNRATIGGMYGNNAAGARSPKFGVMADHVISCEMVLSDGSLVQFGPLTEEELKEKCLLESLEGSIYRKACEIRQESLTFPKIPRHVSGYAIDRLHETPFNLAKVLAGSEGTLGIAVELELNVVKTLPATHLTLYFFETIREAFAFIPTLLQKPFISLEMIDDRILEAAKESFIAKHHLNWVKEGTRCVLYVENEGSGDDELKESVFLVRKKGLELLLSKRGYTRAVGFLEDISYPPEKSLEFYDQFLTLFKDIPEMGIYGHVGAGCLHLRPFIDLRSEANRQEMLHLMEKGTEVLLQLGGSLSGEHGDGMLRSWLNEQLYGEKIYNLFKSFKRAFDPKGILNPGKIISRKFPMESLRSFPKQEIDTFLDFSKEGGLALSADLCNGNGFCRKKEGLMCPSYQATRDEFDTTRARAEMLRQVINKGQGNLKDKDLKKVLDLCLECKGCKTECPSSVDMAKMKAEVLYHQTKSPRDFMFAHLATWWKLGSHIPRLTRWVQSQLGLPPFALEPFSKLQKPTAGNVVLFNDTYTEFSAPQIGTSAVNVLKEAGFTPIIPPWSCCGRPLFSKGFLDGAKKTLSKTIDQLYPLNHPIVVLEPSCYSMLKEDLFSLLGYNNHKAKAVSDRVMLIDEFLFEKMPKIDAPDESILIHTHCHQKSSDKKLSTYDLLKKVGNWSVKEAPSGCCGMAGAFGYEHPEISKKILHLSLMPTIQQTPYTSLIANGFSCRSQISSKSPLHVVELLDRKRLNNYPFNH